uniref:DUF834 domain-containing protein n=1 Tax=Oryza meridionalis TaxID=40149 RepID=A0A0E0CZJ0_9ORYZ
MKRTGYSLANAEATNGAEVAGAGVGRVVSGGEGHGEDLVEVAQCGGERDEAEGAGEERRGGWQEEAAAAGSHPIGNRLGRG